MEGRGNNYTFSRVPIAIGSNVELVTHPSRLYRVNEEFGG